jgi:hypothetical protein
LLAASIIKPGWHVRVGQNGVTQLLRVRCLVGNKFIAGDRRGRADDVEAEWHCQPFQLALASFI